MTSPTLFPIEPEPPAPTPSATPATIGGPAHTQSLYRKYRPRSFDAAELVGQDHIVRTIRNAIALNRVAHAYLFCGPRGTGKTTTARLLAKAINCVDPDPGRRPCNQCDACRAISTGATTDVIEIDAASNRGIDDIRDLRERVKYAPTQLSTKVYVIDEAHQITGAAANAFLKTLEEPPAHTKFVLATTDPEELLPTIVSRCQRFDFRRIGIEPIVGRLRDVASSEGLSIDDDALRVIARHATGSLRDALGLLDAVAVYGDRESAGGVPSPSIDAATVRALLGVSRNDRVELLVMAMAERDPAAALGAINAAVEAGEDARQLNRQLVGYLRVLLHERAGGSADADDRARDLARRFELLELVELTRLFTEIDYKIKHSLYAHLPLEVALVEAVLRGQSAAAPASARAESDHLPRVEAAAKPPTTNLRDRVRGVALPAPPREAPPETAPPQLIARPTPTPAHGATPSATDGAANEVELLIDLWPRIRLDVKTINRRIEALLSSIDPVAVRGGDVTLAAAYAFHRDRVNADEVRGVVEDVIGRWLQRPVRVVCVLRGDEAAFPTPTAPAPPDRRRRPRLSRPKRRPRTSQLRSICRRLRRSLTHSMGISSVLTP